MTINMLENLCSQCQYVMQQPTMDALVGTLHDIIHTFPHMYIVIDALHECSEREEVHDSGGL